MFLLKNFFKLLKILVKAKLNFFPPKKSNILVWGEPSFIEILREKNYKKLFKKFEIFHVWNESINIFILLKCLLKLKFSFLDYANEFIKFSNPLIIFSFLDNHKFFYLLKKNKFQKKILVQNSWRSNEFGFFNIKKTNSLTDVDYIFCHNNNIKKKYNKITNAKIFVKGSFLSNHIQLKKRKKYEILYISTFRHLKNYTINENISFKDYLDSEEKLIKHVANYCEKNKLKLFILPSAREKTIKYEILFFKRCLQDKKNWHLLKRMNKNYKFPYNEIDKAKLVIGLDSTLLYESFGRGLKTIFCDVRPTNNFLSKNRHFGWPKKFPKSGPFWITENKYKVVNTVINKVGNYNNSRWIKINKKFKKYLMVYDEDNQSLIDLLKKLN